MQSNGSPYYASYNYVAYSGVSLVIFSLRPIDMWPMSISEKGHLITRWLAQREENGHWRFRKMGRLPSSFSPSPHLQITDFVYSSPFYCLACLTGLTCFRSTSVCVRETVKG